MLWASLVPWQDTFITTSYRITLTSQARIAALHRRLSRQFRACCCILSTRSLGRGPTNRSSYSSVLIHVRFLIHVNGSQRTLPLVTFMKHRALEASPQCHQQSSGPSAGTGFGVSNNQYEKITLLVTFRNHSNVAKTVYIYKRTCAVKASNIHDSALRHCQYFILSPLLSVAEAFLAVFTLSATPQKGSFGQAYQPAQRCVTMVSICHAHRHSGYANVFDATIGLCS